MQNGIETGGKLIRSARLRISRSTQEGCRPKCYLVPPWFIGTLSSASLPIMSSADVSGFTVFSM